MDAWIRLRRLVPTAGAIALFAGSAGTLSAQSAPPAPFPATDAATTAVEIEVYYGVRKVSPVLPPEPVVEPSSTSDTARAADSFLDALRTLREGTHRVSNAAAGLLNKVAERSNPNADSRQIVLASYSTPSFDPRVPEANAPWLTSRPTPAMLTAAPQAEAASHAPPTIVVIREPAESQATPEPARGLFLSFENIIAVGVAALAFLFGIAVRARSVKRTAEPILAPAAAVDPNAVQLMGQFNAGPLPATAEKFEIGPTYHEEIQQQKVIEEQNNVAAVEFILNQNLALLAALNPLPLVLDQDGFALPESADSPDDDFELEVRGAMPAAA